MEIILAPDGEGDGRGDLGGLAQASRQDKVTNGEGGIGCGGQGDFRPGFPAVIAFWLRVTGQSPGSVVWPVKITQLLFLLAALPLFLSLLERARLPFRYCAAALLTLACCPAFASYANEVMSEAPFLLLCLASVVLVERDLRHLQEEERVAEWRRILSLACATGAFLIRTAGVSLLLALTAWFWRRFGWKWGVAAAVVTLCAVGGWQVRNRRIIANAPPGVRYSTYVEQFTLRDPMRPGTGRIKPNLSGLLLRAYEGFPPYVGMIPRALLHSMSRQSPFWFTVFYALAIPMTLLMALGGAVAWRRGLRLSAGFAALFWLFAAMWPWRDPRFLVPVLPFLTLFLFLGVAWCAEWRRTPPQPSPSQGEGEKVELSASYGAGETFSLQEANEAPSLRRRGLGEVLCLGLLLLYFGQVHLNIIRQERRPLAAGYAFGRTPAEGGFYAACRWLKENTPSESVVMGRPAYMVYLYSDHVATQIEPSENPRAQEKAYMRGHNVRYLIEDVWPWANTKRYLGPYFRDFGNRWRLAWEDSQGSGVKVWERVAPYEEHLPPVQSSQR